MSGNRAASENFKLFQTFDNSPAAAPKRLGLIRSILGDVNVEPGL